MATSQTKQPIISTPFKFQDKEEELESVAFGYSQVILTCPFCMHEISASIIDRITDLHDKSEKKEWTFSYLCPTCKVKGTINVEYHTRTITALGGRTVRIRD
jgi:hypothetical protein